MEGGSQKSDDEPNKNHRAFSVSGEQRRVPGAKTPAGSLIRTNSSVQKSTGIVLLAVRKVKARDNNKTSTAVDFPQTASGESGQYNRRIPYPWM